MRPFPRAEEAEEGGVEELGLDAEEQRLAAAAAAATEGATVGEPLLPQWGRVVVLLLPLALLLGLLGWLLWNWRFLSPRPGADGGGGGGGGAEQPAEAGGGPGRIGKKRARRLEAKAARRAERDQLAAQREDGEERAALRAEQLAGVRRRWRETQEREQEQRRVMETRAARAQAAEEAERVEEAERRAHRRSALMREVGGRMGHPGHPGRSVLLAVADLAREYDLPPDVVRHALEGGPHPPSGTIGVASEGGEHLLLVPPARLHELETAITARAGRVSRAELLVCLLPASEPSPPHRGDDAEDADVQSLRPSPRPGS